MAVESLAAAGEARPGDGRRRPGIHTLVLVPMVLEPEVCRATSRFDLRLEFAAELGLFVTRIESDYPAVLIVDVDLAESLTTLSAFARSLRPDVKIFAVTCYWSERDDGVRGCADAILHKPPRRSQWEAVLGRAGLPRAFPELTHIAAKAS